MALEQQFEHVLQFIDEHLSEKDTIKLLVDILHGFLELIENLLSISVKHRLWLKK